MTARATVINYQGPLSTLNGISDPYAAANWLQRSEEIILQVPFIVDNGVIKLTDETAFFFEAIQLAARRVWIRINLKSAYESPDGAQAGAKTLMATFWSWFKQYNLEDLLKGFYLENFGFDFSYSDTVNLTLTRLHQNYIVQEAHLVYYRPVIVNCKFPNDALTLVGPARGTEDRLPLIRTMVGFNPLLTDYIYLEDPIIASWNADAPSYDKARVLDFLSLATKIRNRTNIKVMAVQRMDVSTMAIDQLTGLSVPDGLRTVMNDYAVFMRALGIGTIGVAATDYGVTSNKSIDPIYVNNDPLIDNDTAYSWAYSKSGHYFIDNPLLPLKDAELPQVNEFNANYHFIAGLTTSGANFTGPQGPTGPSGEQGPVGPVGPAGSPDSDIQLIVADSDPVTIILDTDSSTLVGDCTLGQINFILPVASLVVGKVYKFSKIDAGVKVVRLTVTGGGKLGSTLTVKDLGTKDQYFHVQASVGGWVILASGIAS